MVQNFRQKQKMKWQLKQIVTQTIRKPWKTLPELVKKKLKSFFANQEIVWTMQITFMNIPESIILQIQVG